MQTLPLGNTGLTVTKPAMGCLPLQRCDTDYAVRLLQAAYEGGIIPATPKIINEYCQPSLSAINPASQPARMTPT